MRTGPVKLLSTSTFWPRAIVTARVPAPAGTSRAVKKKRLPRVPLPVSPVTSFGTTRNASGADCACSLVATY